MFEDAVLSCGHTVAASERNPHGSPSGDRLTESCRKRRKDGQMGEQLVHGHPAAALITTTTQKKLQHHRSSTDSGYSQTLPQTLLRNRHVTEATAKTVSMCSSSVGAKQTSHDDVLPAHTQVQVFAFISVLVHSALHHAGLASVTPRDRR